MITCECCNREFATAKQLNGHRSHVKGKATREANYQRRLEAYLSNPELCKQCFSPLTYDNKINSNSFCSQACSATYNNKNRKRPERNFICACCGGLAKGRYCEDSRVYCSSACAHETQVRKKDFEIESGLVSNRPTLRRYFIRKRGHQCECCKNTEWLGDPIPLELDHIDGNATHNLPANLRLLCPNCHAKTPTYKAKNKGNGRQSRGLPSV